MKANMGLMALLVSAMAFVVTGCGGEAAHTSHGHKVAESPSSLSASKPQSKCPIMGGAIDRAQYIDVKGQRVYVCCPGCKSKIKANPGKALAKLASRGEYAESLQKTCPVMGKKIDKKLFVEYQGRRLYACCAGCLVKIRKDPSVFAQKVADSASASS